VKPASKRPKPTFNFGRSLPAGANTPGTGWVYRSDAVLGDKKPAAALSKATAAVVEILEPASALWSRPSTETTSAGPGPTMMSPAWIVGGMFLMAVPMAITMSAIMAPMFWMAGRLSTQTRD